MSLVAFMVLAQESGVADGRQKADAGAEKPVVADSVETAKKADDTFKPPPGFQTKKRGDLVLYCQKDATIGTRFKTEKCYDEAQMREYMLALEQQKLDVDRIRATCGGGTMCAPPDPTPR